MTKDYCDRCGDEFEFELSPKVRAYINEGHQPVDLCKDCQKALRLWLSKK